MRDYKLILSRVILCMQHVVKCVPHMEELSKTNSIKLFVSRFASYLRIADDLVIIMVWCPLTLADKSLSDQSEHDTGARVTLGGRVEGPHYQFMHALSYSRNLNGGEMEKKSNLVCTLVFISGD